MSSENKSATNAAKVLIASTTDILSAYVSKNSVSAAEMPALISGVHAALASLGNEPTPLAKQAPAPAVSVKRSVHNDFIICLEDGKKFKSLRRHLSTLGLTPDAYRAKWNLPASYPMVAPSYSATRSQLAKSSGLGAPRSAMRRSVGAPAERGTPSGRRPKKAA